MTALRKIPFSSLPSVMPLVIVAFVLLGCIEISTGCSAAEPLAVSAVTPSTVGLGGGVLLTIIGHGFPPTAQMTAAASVQIKLKFSNGVLIDCPLAASEALTHSKLVCGPLPGTNTTLYRPTTARFSASVRVLYNSSVATGTLTYAPELTPIVDYLPQNLQADSPATFKLKNRATRVPREVYVSVGKYGQCSILQQYGATADAVLPPLPDPVNCVFDEAEAGLVNVSLIIKNPEHQYGVASIMAEEERWVYQMGNDGIAATTYIQPTITKVLPTTAIGPGGGVMLTIQGSGFSANLATTNVTIGDGLNCRPVSCSKNEIRCLTDAGSPAKSRRETGGLTRRVYVGGSFLSSGVTLAQLEASELYSTSSPTYDALFANGLRVMEFPDVTLPRGETLDGYLNPPEDGRYTFYCAASDFVQVMIAADSSSEVTSLELCYAESTEYNVTTRYSGGGRAIGSDVYLQKGRSYRFTVNYGVSKSTSFYSVSTRITPGANRSTFPTPDGLPFSTLPHTIEIASRPTQSQATFSSGFFVYYGGSRVFVGAIPINTPCSTASVAKKLKTAFADLTITESIREADSTCYWTLAFELPKGLLPIYVDGADLRNITVGSTEMFHDPVPNRFFERQSLTTTAQWALRVRVGDFPAVSAKSYTPKVVFNANLAAPVLSSIFPTSILRLDSKAVAKVTMTGTNFPPIGEPIITFTRVTDTSIVHYCSSFDVAAMTCVVPNMPAGRYAMTVRYENAGGTQPVSLTQNFSLVSPSPSSSTQYGDIPMTVTGRNFPVLPSELKVTIAGEPCRVTRVLSQTKFVCYVPPLPANPTVDAFNNQPGTYTIEAAALVPDENGQNPVWRSVGTNTARFKYLFDQGPVVDSVSPSGGAGAATDRLTIRGANLTVGSSVLVELCDSAACHACYILNQSNTEITCFRRAVPNGKYIVLVRHPDGTSNRDVFYTANFLITSVTPQAGSIQGGALVTLIGSGFSKEMKVSIGGELCEVDGVVSTTEFQCAASPSTNLGVPLEVKAYIPHGPEAFCDAEATGGCIFFYNYTTTRPYVSAVNPRSGQAESITFTGINFPHSADQLEVTVGPVLCPVKKFRVVPETENVVFSCMMVRGYEAGPARVNVRVLPYGYVSPDRSELFDYIFTLSVNRVYPDSSSVAGGRLVTVVGTGFGPSTVVTLARIQCMTSSIEQDGPGVVNTTHLVCETGALSYIEDRTGSVGVSTTGTQLSSSCCEFKYDSSKTLRLREITPQSGIEGDFVEISVSTASTTNERPHFLSEGINNTVSSPIVKITLAGTTVSQMSHMLKGLTYQGINITIPVTPALQAPIVIWTVHGKAWNSRSQSFQMHARLQIINSTSDILEANSPMGGGKNVTVYGARFYTAPTDLVTVSVCSNPCRIIEISYNRIVCTAPRQVNRRSLNVLPAALTRSSHWLPLTAYNDPELAAIVFDGDVSTTAEIVRSIGTGLTLTFSFGEYIFVFVSKVAFYVPSGYEQELMGATVETSDDALVWAVRATLSFANPSWNTVELNAHTNARFVRLSGPSRRNKMHVGELQVWGTYGSNSDSDFCPLVVGIQPRGSTPMSTCSDRPVQCYKMEDKVYYSDDVSPIITKITPAYGPTVGGTQVTFSGYNFCRGSTCNTAVFTVTLDGIPCHIVGLISPQTFTCRTGARKSFISKVETIVHAEGMGYALLKVDPFHYADKWSASATWGSEGVPMADSIVVVPEGSSIILDVSPPPLTALIIQGTLQVETGTASKELTADYILVDGGKFIAGSPEQGLTNFNLTLRRSPHAENLPVYGESVLAVENGKLSMATDFAGAGGIRAYLANTAEPGANNLTLASTFAIASGDRIAISSSYMDFEETEIHTVATASGQQLTLVEPLKYRHYGGVQWISQSSETLILSSSVVKLSRGVVIQGPSDTLTTGFGGHVLIRGQSEVTLTDVEIRDMGQRGAPNRHPITIDQGAAMLGSKIRRCVVHRSVNRGIVLSSTSHFVIEENVVVDTEGHGIALVGGATRYNTLTDNVVLMSKSSSGGLDQIVANFYISHPSNDIQGNVAGGAHHSGFWLHFLPNTEDGSGGLCPDQGTSGTFTGNSAFSNRFHGLWVYPQHIPRQRECAYLSPQVDGVNPVVGTNVLQFVAFHNGHAGISLGVVGGYILTACQLAGNGDAGLTIVDTFDTTVTVTLSYFLARTVSVHVVPPANLTQGLSGIRTPRSDGLVVSKTKFYNYSLSNPHPEYALSTCHECENTLGGFTTTVSELEFVFSPAKLSFGGHHNDMLVDLDGSMSMWVSSEGEVPPFTILPRWAHVQGLPGCIEVPTTVVGSHRSLETYGTGVGGKAMACNNSYSFHRLNVITKEDRISAAGVASGAPTIDSAVGNSSINTTSMYGTQVWPQISTPSRRGFSMFFPTGTVPWHQEIMATWSGDYLVNYSHVDVHFLLNFTTNLTSATADWSGALLELSTYNELRTNVQTQRKTLDLNLGYATRYVRVDAFQRTFARQLPAYTETYLTPLAERAAVIPTFYRSPKQLNVSGGVTHAFLDNASDTATFRFSSLVGSQSESKTEVLFIETKECAVTGCIFMLPPLDPPDRLSWTDSRAWIHRNREIPGDGADVIIEPGKTLTLNGQTTARLRSLVIQGTLEIGSGDKTTINTHYLVVYGGTITVTTSASGYLGYLTINLLSSQNVAPLGIDENLILQPGSMVVFGSIYLVGPEKLPQWSKMGETKNSGAELKAEEEVKWTRGDHIVLSSSFYDPSRSEEATFFGGVNQSQTADRTFLLTRKIQHPHLGFTDDISDEVKVFLGSEIAVLTRNIVIQSSDWEEVQENHNRAGCEILFGEFGADPTFAAQGIISDVEVRYCGRYNTTIPAVKVQSIRRSAVVFQQSAVHHSLSHAMLVEDTSLLTIQSSVFYHSYGSTVVMGEGSSGNLVEKNLAFGTHFPDWMREPENQGTPYALCSFESRLGINAFLDNVAGGSESEGFCVQLGEDCDMTSDSRYLVSGNEAHSNVVGFFVAHANDAVFPPDGSASHLRASAPSEGCVAMETLHAWRNSYVGLHSAVNRNVNYTSLRLHNNHISLYIGGQGSGNGTVSSSLIVGRSDAGDPNCTNVHCSTNTFDRSCDERWHLWRDGSRKLVEGEIGVLMGSFLEKTRQANYSRAPSELPVTIPEQTSRSALSGGVSFIGTTFAQFNYGRDVATCDGSTAVVTEGFATTPVASALFANTTWLKSVDEGRVYIHSVSPFWATERNMCGNKACDALNHVLIHDEDGTFLEKGVSTRNSIVSNYYHAALSSSCTLIEDNNAYYCTDIEYLELQVENKDSDAQIRLIEPLKVQDQDFLARINSVYQPPDCTRLDCTDPKYSRRPTFTTNVESRRTYLVDFGEDPPRRTVWRAQNCQPALNGQAPASVIVRIRFPQLMELAVWVKGRDDPVPPTTKQIGYGELPGQNYFEATDTRLYLLVPCGSEVEVHQLVYADLGLTIGVAIEDFVFNYQSTFLDHVSNFLIVDRSRIKFKEVYPGSTVAVFRISAVDSAAYDSTFEANEVNSLVMRFLTSTPEELTKALHAPIIGIESITWAQGTPSLSNPIPPAIGLSSPMLTTIIVCSVAVFFLLIGLSFFVYKRLLQYRDATETHEVEREVSTIPDFQHAAFAQKEEAVRPRQEVQIKALNIRIDEDEFEERTNLIQQQPEPLYHRPSGMDANQGGFFGHYGEEEDSMGGRAVEEDDDVPEPTGDIDAYVAFGTGGGGTREGDEDGGVKPPPPGRLGALVVMDDDDDDTDF